jgi:small-conductance mechanosensitive channel
MRAGIEVMAVIREWRGALVNAVQNGYPVTDAFVANYRGQASTNLRLASVAASTDSDHNAFQLVSNEFDNMQKLSNKILAARKNMNYLAPDALKGDPLDQQILSCARSLAAMAASGQFQDDGSCH